MYKRQEIVLRDVAAPARVGQGETFRLEVSAESATATEAVLRVLGDGAVVYEETVRLQPGVNNFVIRLQAGEPAFARYRVQLSPLGAADAFPQNNELAAYTEITGQPRVLIVAAAGAGDDGHHLIRLERGRRRQTQPLGHQFARGRVDDGPLDPRTTNVDA